MTYILILIAVFFLIIGLAYSKNNIFSPSVLTSAVWIVCMILLIYHSSQLPTLSFNFYLCVFLWMAGICLSSAIPQSATFQDSKLNDPGKTIRDVYLIVSVFIIPKLILFAKTAIENGETGVWAFDLRMAALGQGSGFHDTLGGLIVLVTQCSFMLELLCYDKKKKWRLIVATFCYLLYGAVSMSKLAFLNIFLYACVILYFKKRISIKQILGGLGILLAFFLILQSVRHSIEISDAQSTIVSLYILGNFFAFDTLEPCTALHWGENVFRAFYSMFYKLGLSDIESINPFLEWVYKPIPTNTYTTLYPFYVDFGIWGIIIFSILLGFLYGYFFRKAQTGSNFHLLVYAVIVGILVMQYAADQFFFVFAFNLKVFILLFIPFFMTKNNLLNIKNKCFPKKQS